MTEGVFTPAHVLAEAMRRLEVSSVEVLDAHLAHIASHNPDLNAIVTLDEDGARLRAQEADAALGRGEVWGALHGVPITLEDAHPTSGIRTAWGSKRQGPSSWARPTVPRSGPTRSSPEPTTPGILRVLPGDRAQVSVLRSPRD